MPDFLTRRNGAWHFVRRVPTEFSHLDRRGVVKHSTKIKIANDRNGVRASKVADEFNKGLEQYWAGLASGIDADKLSTYEDARRRALALGFEFVPAKILNESPIEATLQRLETIGAKGLQDDAAAVAGLTGTIERPAFKVANLFTEYERETRDEIKDLSKDQLRIWRNGKIRAVKNFVQVVGNITVTDINQTHGLLYRQMWVDRVVNEDIKAKTANKDIGHLSHMFRGISVLRRLNLPDIFAGLRLKGEEDSARVPFENAFIQKRLLAPGALDGLNDDARYVLYVIADSGLRPSEIVNLRKETIHLHAEVPYVEILPDGRRPKTKDSIRTIPLVGAALAAMRKRPNGFPRYRDKSSGLSATVNKFLLENDLRPTPEHTVYSLRHSFKDRLIDIKAEDSIIDVLMGHKTHKPKYGKGPSLVRKLEILQQIAFTPPDL